MRAFRADILLLVVTLAAFYPVLSNDFVGWDDPYWIFGNPRLNPPTLENLGFHWTHAQMGLYVPIAHTYWFALATIARSTPDVRGAVHLEPLAFHVGSLLLHVMSALVTMRILRRLTFGEMASLIGAMLFALHPLQVESVAWASGAKDVLAGLLSLVVVWQYLLFRERDRAAGRTHYVLALVAMLLAMLAKPSAMMVPVVLIILNRIVAQREWKRITLAIWPFVLIAMPFVIIARQAQITSAVPYTPIWQRPLIAGDALTFYLSKLVAPISLSVDYGHTPAVAMRGPLIWFAWIAPVTLLIAVCIKRRSMPMLLAGVLIFVASLAPVLGLTPFQNQVHSTVADHYAYVALLGAAIALAWIVDRWPRAKVGFGIVLVIFAVLSNLQTRTWHDSITLFSNALRVNPNIAMIHNNLGNALAGDGKIDQAVEHFRSALELDPTDHLARTSLAQAQLQLGNFEDAVAQSRIAMQHLLPGEEPGKEHLIAGLALMQLGRYDEAIAEFEDTLKTQPDNTFAAAQLNRARERRGQSNH